MKWMIIFLIVLVALIALMYLLGFLLPQHHAATVQYTFVKTSPSQVWHAITSIPDYTSWRHGVKNIQMVAADEWKESVGHDVIHYKREIPEPGKILVTKIVNKDLPYGGTWTYVLASEGEGTILSITENGEVYNPLFRFLSKFVFGHHMTMRKYVEDLKMFLNKK